MSPGHGACLRGGGEEQCRAEGGLLGRGGGGKLSVYKNEVLEGDPPRRRVTEGRGQGSGRGELAWER